MTVRRRLAAFVVGALVLASCSDDGGPAADEARIEVDGSVTVVAADGSTGTLTNDATLDFGDRVTVDAGSAMVELAGGQQYELRSGPTPSVLEIASPPVLASGDVLVVAGFPAQVRLGTTTVSAMGAMKVVSAVPSVVSYAGRARIDGAGRLDEVVALRQVVLTSSAIAEPLVYDGADEWDRRYLAEAMAFGDRLEALGRGYTADLGADSVRSASFYEAVIPALGDDREFSADLLGDRRAGETIIGASIVVQGRDDTFRTRWNEVFEFRDEGAAWGLVALDQGVSSAPVLDTVELAVAAPQPPSTSTVPSTPTSTSRPPVPTTDGSDPGPTTSTPPDPDPTPPTTGLLDPIADPVAAILEDLLGIIGL
ncbi:hypothetical protein [Actinospongicola halichondriae]|uniref:hypothetical protein n=1 Tax=Actinospongicola halichondriae TaxID=3236844 RepID=UPI003D4A3591